MRKGLKDWDAARDAAFEAGFGSSVDIPAEKALNDTEQSGTMEFLAHVMRLEPRKPELETLTKLSDNIDELMKMAFGNITEVIDSFYGKLDKDFSKLESSELERLILSIQRVIFNASGVVAELYNDAYFSDRIQQDEYWAAYRTPMESKVTMDDRRALAHDQTRDSRFYYYFRFLVWRRMQEKLSALKDLQKTLEWYRSRTIKDRPF